MDLNVVRIPVENQSRTQTNFFKKDNMALATVSEVYSPHGRGGALPSDALPVMQARIPRA